MKTLSFSALVLAAAVACAGPSPRPTTAPTPAPAATPTPVKAAAPPSEAQRNCQLLDETTDGVPGISAERAQRELLAGKQPARTVLVAIIDGGIDTAHAELRANLWTNPKEVAGNSKDDDNNGYVDDLHGWNFIGGKDGKDVHYDTFELTRLYGWCTNASSNAGPVSPDEKSKCDAIKRDFEKTKSETQSNLEEFSKMDAFLAQVLPVLRKAAGTDSLTKANVAAIQPQSQQVAQARQVYLGLAEQGISPKDVVEAKTEYESRMQYGLNPAYNPRAI